ncbi:MAG: DUF4290 domain-containing protein [Bacteroidales bacterium]|nr:DUF4290 domain-containing protein [Bacteroidales bacterium]
MEYNTDRERLILPEYGRNLQKMIESISSIEDKELRSAVVKDIVNVMAQMTAGNKDGDFWHKLWDQVYIMSDYQLDINSPFPVPTPEEVHAKPKTLPYKPNNIKFRHYGNLIHSLINEVINMEDSSEKDKCITLLATQMKKLYLTWNRDTVDDELIFKNMEELSDSQISLNPEDLRLASTASILSHDKIAPNANSKSKVTADKKKGKRKPPASNNPRTKR